MRDQAGGEEDQDAGEGEKDEGREQTGDVEAVLRLDQPEGEAGAGPGSAGGELADHRGDQREAAGDAEAREEVGSALGSFSRISVCQGLAP